MLEQFVADMMSGGVVDLLEMIEVDQEQAACDPVRRARSSALIKRS